MENENRMSLEELDEFARHVSNFAKMYRLPLKDAVIECIHRDNVKHGYRLTPSNLKILFKLLEEMI